MLKITPNGKVIGSMSEEEGENTPVLLGLKDEPAGSGDVKILIEVVFQSVKLEPPVGKGYWRCAGTGAEIELHAAGAVIGAHTTATKLPVKYKISEEKETTVDAKVKPEAEVSEGVKVSPGEAGFERKTSAGGEAEFEGNENPLAVIEKGDTVVWQYTMTRGHKVVRDYLLETLKLQAECKWGAKKKQGRVRLRTTTSFFDQKEKSLAGWKTLWFGMVLSLRDYEIANRDGIEVQFHHSAG